MNPEDLHADWSPESRMHRGRVSTLHKVASWMLRCHTDAEASIDVASQTGDCGSATGDFNSVDTEVMPNWRELHAARHNDGCDCACGETRPKGRNEDSAQKQVEESKNSRRPAIQSKVLQEVGSQENRAPPSTSDAEVGRSFCAGRGKIHRGTSDTEVGRSLCAGRGKIHRGTTDTEKRPSVCAGRGKFHRGTTDTEERPSFCAGRGKLHRGTSDTEVGRSFCAGRGKFCRGTTDTEERPSFCAGRGKLHRGTSDTEVGRSFCAGRGKIHPGTSDTDVRRSFCAGRGILHRGTSGAEERPSFCAGRGTFHRGTSGAEERPSFCAGRGTFHRGYADAEAGIANARMNLWGVGRGHAMQDPAVTASATAQCRNTVQQQVQCGSRLCAPEPGTRREERESHPSSADLLVYHDSPPLL